MNWYMLPVYLVMIVGGATMFFQGYPFWRTYRNRDSLYWWMLGAVAIFLGSWEIATHLLVAETSTLQQYGAISRKILVLLVLAFSAFVGWREYGWK